MYTVLTGVSLRTSATGGREPTFTATSTGDDGCASTFALGPSDDDHAEELEYTPLSGCDLLPTFLQQAIAFTKDQAPLFLSKVIEALRSGGDDSEAGTNNDTTVDD